MVRVLFVHPDLGIGGAERLVVDAALALQSKGHTVSFLTNHHDPNHCFDETKDGRLPVMTVGDWLPRDIFGKFYAVCAYIRMLYAAFYYSLFLSKKEPVDVVFCDLISLGIPIFRLARPNPSIRKKEQNCTQFVRISTVYTQANATVAEWKVQELAASVGTCCIEC